MLKIEAKLIALGIVLPALASFFTALRFWTRHTRHTRLGLDDALIVVAVSLVWGMGITQVIGRQMPLPTHEDLLTYRRFYRG